MDSQARGWAMGTYTWSAVLVGSLALAGAVMALVLTPFLDLAPGRAAEAVLAVNAEPVRDELGLRAARYLPPRPEEAPEALRGAVLQGGRLMAETRRLAPGHVGNDLSCNSCHFEGGRTAGGRNGGISLVGSAAVYPAPRAGPNAARSLAGQVNACFQESLNGAPLAEEGPEMSALLAYLQWISRGVPVYAEVPWRGLRPLESEPAGSGTGGPEVFRQFCAVCHGAEGQGTPIATPLWGERSFGAGAGLSQPAKLAAFTLANMPRENPILTPEQAWDVANFISRQPRPGAGQR